MKDTKKDGGFLDGLKTAEIFWAPLITFLILLAVFAFKHIYPFGSGTVDQYGMTDAHLPMYAHTWDVMHGKASLYYDWLSGAGNDVYISLGFYVLNPFSLFFLFVSRDKLLESMSFFLMLKLMLASASQAFYLKKEYGKNTLQNTAIALFYAFCGYTLQQYGNIFYLDTVIMFPLLMYSLKRMIKTRKGFAYLFAAALTVITNPYLGAMSLIFVVFYVSGYLWFIAEKDESRRITAQLGQYTLIALLLSMFVLCPAVFKWLRSARMELLSELNYTAILKSSPNNMQGSKIFMLCGTEIGFAAIIAASAGIKTLNKREMRKLSFNIYLIFITIIPVAVESVQYLWNLGTDTGVPMRYAFILTFALLDFYKYASEDGMFSIAIKDNQKNLVRLTAAIMAAVCAGMFVLLAGHADINTFNVSGKTIFIPAFASAVIFFCLLAGEKNIGYRSIAMLVFAVIHSVVICADFIAPSGYNTAVTENYKFVSALQRKTKFGLSDDVLSRVKIIEPSAFPNYPLTANIPSLSTKTNEASKEYIRQMYSMGY
ncbi:MAG: YfhO family protein, partial [Firmicutes bacterium]|nr:YfhO family protein [Bacillota bacterium]